MAFFPYIKSALMDIVFPKVCSLCGMPLSGHQQFICTNCVQTRFDDAFATAEDHLNLPESVKGRLALWQFDKGGYLQDLLHSLKYHRLTNVGIDLGVALAVKMKQVYKDDAFNISELILLPVPLHPKKRKMRGFNQAYYIAKGIENVFGGQILPKNAVVRTKNTKTQTGFSLEKRRANISDAFKVNDIEWVTGKTIFIIDDVFTTGATGFELAQVLKDAGAESIFIVTVAQA